MATGDGQDADLDRRRNRHRPRSGGSWSASPSGAVRSTRVEGVRVALPRVGGRATEPADPTPGGRPAGGYTGLRDTQFRREHRKGCGMSELRRLLPRQFADSGSAKYSSFEGGPDLAWHDCNVIDISSAGAGLELPAPIWRRLWGATSSSPSTSEASFATPVAGRDDAVRAGIQFLGLSPAEHRVPRFAGGPPGQVVVTPG